MLKTAMEKKVEDIVQLERGALRPEELGLTLMEAKAILHGMQQSLVTEQVAAYVGQYKNCPDCGARRTRKGHHPIVYRTLFGKCNLLSPRLYDCACRNNGRHSSSPLAELLTSHCAPELLYLQAKFASLMSYGLSVELLSDVLPIADEINPTSVRRHLHRVAERIEEAHHALLAVPRIPRTIRRSFLLASKRAVLSARVPSLASVMPDHRRQVQPDDDVFGTVLLCFSLIRESLKR
jgi:hypothetical protein